MGALIRRIALMKSTHITLSVIAFILILLKVNTLRVEPNTPAGILISQGRIPVHQDSTVPDWVGDVVDLHPDKTITVKVENAAPTKTLERYVTVTVTETPLSTSFLSLATQEALPLPEEYAYQSTQSSFCIDRFTTRYLDLLRDGKTDYCAQDGSSSRLSCFHTPSALHDDGHLDSFCIGQDVHFDKASQRFIFDCGKPETNPAIQLVQLHGYWYETGPQHIFEDFVKINVLDQVDVSTPRTTTRDLSAGARNFTILLKREGAHNVFHSLHELMSLAYTMDVLRMTRDSNTGEPYFKSPEDRQNTQLVILDDYPEGPYWDLWNMFSTQPPIRLADFVARNPEQPLEALGNVIVPLAGAANPIWHDDWEKVGCVNEIRRTFVKRVVDFYGIEDDKSPLTPKRLTMTIVDRKQTRRLFNLDSLVNATRRAYPDVKVQVIDWAALPFEKQVETARKTDILVGIHGAGLTQALFMKESRGAMVEIMPDTGINCFHAIAMERDLHYYRAHGKVAEKKDDWHNEDVLIDEDKFLLLIDHAVKSLYNRPGRFRDLYVD